MKTYMITIIILALVTVIFSGCISPSNEATIPNTGSNSEKYQPEYKVGDIVGQYPTATNGLIIIKIGSKEKCSLTVDHAPHINIGWLN